MKQERKIPKSKNIQKHMTYNQNIRCEDPVSISIQFSYISSYINTFLSHLHISSSKPNQTKPSFHSNNPSSPTKKKWLSKPSTSPTSLPSISSLNLLFSPPVSQTVRANHYYTINFSSLLIN
jgi:hypothetical protein